MATETRVCLRHWATRSSRGESSTRCQPSPGTLGSLEAERRGRRHHAGEGTLERLTLPLGSHSLPRLHRVVPFGEPTAGSATSKQVCNTACRRARSS